jgi:hypothetical protein
VAEFNAAQQVVLKNYGGGDYAERFNDMDDLESEDDLGNVGDTLFLFLMRELADSEECDTLEEAQRRVDIALGDLQAVRDALSEAEQVEAEAVSAS